MAFARTVEEAEFKRITMVMEGMRDVRGEDSEKLAQVIKEKMNQQIAEWKSQEEEEWMKQNGKALPSPNVPTHTPAPAVVEMTPSNYDFQSKSPEKWSTEDVANWLIHMGFSEFVSLFKGNELFFFFFLFPCTAVMFLRSPFLVCRA